MATDRILAVAALLVFAGFLGVVAISVKRVDLMLVCALGVALAGYDFWRAVFGRAR